MSNSVNRTFETANGTIIPLFDGKVEIVYRLGFWKGCGSQNHLLANFGIEVV
jgi:hypothetical protein